MRLYHTFPLAIGILLGSSALLAAAEPNVGELAQELKGEKPAATRTAEQLDAVYVQVLDSLLADLAAEDTGRRNGAQETLQRIAFQASRPGADADRAACSKAIAAKLGPDVGTLARVWLIRQLERIGRAEAVSQLAKTLTDKETQVRESARRALQKNTSNEANAALQQAVGSADSPAWRVALINAVAERRDPANVAVLTKEAGSDNDDIRTAAVIGLARLGDSSSVALIEAAMQKGSPAARHLATNSYVRLAEALAARGDKGTALGIYKKLLASDGYLKCAGIIGIGRTGTPGDLPTIFAALADENVKIRGACVEALCLLPGNEVIQAIVAQVKSAKPEVKLGLLQALARRADKAAQPVFLAAAEDADEPVQVAALAGLGAIGDAGAVSILLKNAATGGKPQETARQSLQVLVGQDVDKAILAAIEDKDPKVKAEVVRALAARHVVAATQALLKTAEDADGGVRNESIRAVGAVGPTDALAGLAAVLVRTQDDGARNEAASALVKIANRDQDSEKRAEPILQALGSASGPAKFALLNVLGRVGGQKSLEGMRAALKDNDEKIRDAAIRALAEWPDATAAEDLLNVAKTAASETHQVIALRGYIRVASNRNDRPDAERAKLLVAGLATAKRPDEKRQALNGLAEVRELVALQAVVPYMDVDNVKEEAASAARRISQDLWHSQPEAVKAAMQKVLAVSKNDNLKREAQEVLDRAEQRLKEISQQKK